MDNAFTFWELWYIFWGYGYLVNYNTKEIHRINNKHHNCKIETMSKKTSEHVTRRQAIKLIKKHGFNGCRWCWKNADLG